jgi:hypothetical protein
VFLKKINEFQENIEKQLDKLRKTKFQENIEKQLDKI